MKKMMEQKEEFWGVGELMREDIGDFIVSFLRWKIRFFIKFYTFFWYNKTIKIKDREYKPFQE